MKFLLSGLGFIALALLPMSVLAIQPYNMPVGVTDISQEVFELHMLIYWICVVIGIVVFGVMMYSMIMHRKAAGYKAAQFHESTTAEILWTVVPLVVLIGMAVVSAKVLIKMEDSSQSDLTIKVTGYQWLWHYEYINDGVDFYSVLSTPRKQIYNAQEKGKNYLLEVDKELVLPVGKKIRFLITSSDVLHAWWVPDLAVKKDAVPGYINESWAQINKPGVYRGQCAELCGRDHGFMPIVVRALSEDKYQEWLANMKSNQQSPVSDSTGKPSLSKGVM